MMSWKSWFRRSRPSARYYASVPLFPLSRCAYPLASGSYARADARSTILFRRVGEHYVVSGDATPETVTLIPVDRLPGCYIFQQSQGLGVAFYGLLRSGESGQGFALFSPETRRDLALALARSAGVTPGAQGCCFTDARSLTHALVELGAGAPDGCWKNYQSASV